MGFLYILQSGVGSMSVRPMCRAGLTYHFNYVLAILAFALMAVYPREVDKQTESAIFLLKSRGERQPCNSSGGVFNPSSAV